MFPHRQKPAKADNRAVPLSDSNERQQPHIPLPAEIYQDMDALTAYQRQVQAWADEAYEEFVKNGGMDHLPGKGKPLVVPTGDVFESIIKNAKIEPPWIMLRKQVKQLMEQTATLMDESESDDLVDELISEINENIKQMNLQAPSLSLHRKRITRQTLHEQLEKWI